jgi:transposase
MAKFKNYEIGSDHSVVIDLSQHLPFEHLSKQMEKIISSLDTSAIEATYSGLGQNALHPKLLLSIIFYGYAVGIRSGRKLAKACEENLGFIYLSKNYRPQKSCINDFRRDNYLHFGDLFVQVLKKCQEFGLGDATFSIVDGSKEESNSSKGRTKTAAQYEKWQQVLLDDIASLEKDTSAEVSQKKNSSE